MNTKIYSVYMDNIDPEMVDAQRRCVLRVMPEEWKFEQVKINCSHGKALNDIAESSKDELLIYLDIDCIPLTQLGLLFLAKCVMQDSSSGENHGLAGAIQRANHIQNNRHFYIGPFCMAFSSSYYKELGSPSFEETERGDVGEELTYRWTERSGFLSPAGMNPHKYSSDIHFLWPTQVRQPLWDLDFGWRFGIGSTYGAASAGPSLFYHTFNARDPKTKEMFLWECDRMLSSQRRIA